MWRPSGWRYPVMFAWLMAMATTTLREASVGDGAE